MEGLDLWRLCDEMSVAQAALLLAGHDPSSTLAHAESWQVHERPDGYEAAKTAIANALRRKHIDGVHIPHYEYDMNGNPCGDVPASVNVDISRVDVESLKIWLMGRGLSTGFFFPEIIEAPDYLDPVHPRYAPKLAAAVHAWLAIEDTKGKSPKQALEKWLRENAVRFGLTNDDGNPNGTGIEEAAKVANWQPGGGAPKTPA